MIRSSRPVINELIGYGVDFARKADGSLDYTREGCHSRARILFHEDITGKEITSHLLAAVRQLPNVTIRDLRLWSTSSPMGIAAWASSPATVRAVIRLSRPMKRFWPVAVSAACMTIRRISLISLADALAIAMRHGVELEHIDYVQIHPTVALFQKAGPELPYF